MEEEGKVIKLNILEIRPNPNSLLLVLLRISILVPSYPSESCESNMMCEGEAQQKAIKENLTKQDVIEQGMKDIFPSGVPSFQDGNLGYLDIVFYSLFGIHEAIEEVFGINFLAPERYPLLASWAAAMSETPVVKQVMPPTTKLVEFLQLIRQNLQLKA